MKTIKINVKDFDLNQIDIHLQNELPGKYKIIIDSTDIYYEGNIKWDGSEWQDLTKH